MERQLVLLEDNESDWRLDERTRQLGRQGVAEARNALREALRAKPSLEQRRRIETVLAALIQAPQPLTPEGLRDLRAVSALGRMRYTPLLQTGPLLRISLFG